MQSKSIVLDTGSGHTKIGWSTQTIPQATYPSVVGRPLLRTRSRIEGIKIKDVMVGKEARLARAVLDLKYPVEAGVIKNWDDMKELWNFGFEQLGAKTEECKILLTEQVLNATKNRQKMVELAFEEYRFTDLQIQIQALLSMFSEGRLTASVLDSGDSSSYIIPVADGAILRNLIKKVPLAGRTITERLTKLLFLRGYAFNSSADFETVREIKEKLCFVR
jgi:actin-related protein 2